MEIANIGARRQRAHSPVVSNGLLGPFHLSDSLPCMRGFLRRRLLLFLFVEFEVLAGLALDGHPLGGSHTAEDLLHRLFAPYVWGDSEAGEGGCVGRY